MANSNKLQKFKTHKIPPKKKVPVRRKNKHNYKKNQKHMLLKNKKLENYRSYLKSKTKVGPKGTI